MWEDAGGRWQMHDQAGGGWWLMVLLMLVVTVAVIVGVVALLRGWTPAGPASVAAAPRAADPRAILQERFARGEIDEQDFRARMRALDEAGG